MDIPIFIKKMKSIVVVLSVITMAYGNNTSPPSNDTITTTDDTYMTDIGDGCNGVNTGDAFTPTGVCIQQGSNSQKYDCQSGMRIDYFSGTTCSGSDRATTSFRKIGDYTCGGMSVSYVRPSSCSTMWESNSIFNCLYMIYFST